MSQRVDLTQFFTRRQSDIRYLKAPVPANPPTSLTQNASAIVQGTTDFFAYIDVHLTDPTLPTGVNAPQYVQAYLFTYSYVSAGVTVVKSVYLPWLSGGIYRVQPVPPGASVSINAETVDFTGQKSVNSSTLSATAASDSTAPAAPTITGSAVNSGGQITITSSLNAESDFDHYELWRGTGPDSGHITWDSTPIIKFFGTSIVDTAIATSTTYWYKVIAKDFSGNSSTSNIAGPLALTTTAASPPSTPNMTGSAATPQPDGSITFTFHPNSDVTLSGYRIWRRVHGTTQWELIHTLTASPSVPDPVSYNDASTILGTQYDYTVTAISTTAGESGFPAAFATGTAAETQVPNAVTNVTITGRVGGVVVKWTPSTSTDVVSYTTNYRLTTGGSFQASDEVVTTNNLQILGLTATRDALANQLQVRVVAVNKAGIQSTSVLTTADFPSLATYRPADNTIPTGPASITITKNDDGSILLSWPASVSVDRSGYQIEIWDSVSVAWSILTTIDNDQSGTITYRVVGLEPFKFRSKQYRFRVRTVDYSGNISSVNLVENPGFETGSLSPNWSNNSGTGFVATIQASSAFEGTDCLKSNNAASINQSVTVTTNVPYTLSAFIAQDPSFPGEIATIRIDWYNSGTFLSSAVSGNITTSSTYQRAVVTSTAPGTATRALLVLVGSTVNPTRTVLHDAVQFEQAAGASGYYDGKTPLVNAIDNQAPQDYSNVSGTNFLNMSVQGMLGQITLHWNNPPSSFSGAFDYIGGVFEIWRQVTASNQSTLSVDGSARKIVEVPANSDGAANKFDDLDPIETASVSATYFLKARDRYGNSSATFLNGGVGLSATSITLSQNQDSLVHEGTASGSTPAFSYHQISAQSYVIASGDKLEYDVFVELNTANLYQFALDFEYGASHLAFRSTSILDQNGLSATPATDISAFAKATWYHRIFDLTSLAGQTINTWASAHEADTSAKYRGRLANIKITNGSTLKSIIYSSGSVGTTTAWTIGGAGDTNYSSVNVYTSDLSVGSVNLDVQVSDGTTFLRQFGYSAEPLIGNPTFEQGGASPTGSDSGWVASIGSTANMTYETSVPLAGSRSLKLTGTIGNNIQMVNRMKFTAKPGDVVFLQGLGSVSVAGVKGFLGIQFSDQTGTGSGAGTIAFTSTTPGTLSLQTTAGANTVSGFIYAKYDSTSTANGSALFDSILASRVRSLDNEIADGTTYGRPILTRLNAGRPLIDFSESIHLSKHLGNIPDDVGSTRFAVSTIDAARRALIDFSQGGHSNKILDNIGDGVTFGRPLLARLSSGKPWIDFSEGIHANKHLGNMPDDLTSGRIAWDPTSKSRGQSQGNLVLNGSFDRGDTYNWVPGSPEYTGIATAYTLVQSISIDSSDGGRIGNFAGDSIGVLTQYLIPVTTSRRYLIEVRLRAGAGTAGSAFYAGFASFDKSKAYIPLGPAGATFTYTLAQNLSTPASWTTYSAVITGEELVGDHSVAPNDSQQTDVHKFRFGTKYITPLLLLNRTVTGATTDVDYVKIVELSSVAENHPRFTNLDNTGALDFAPTHRNKHLGNIPDDSGSTRFAVSSIDAARKALIDFSQGGHANKQLDNIPDGTTYARMHATYLAGGQLLTSEFPGATVNPDGSMSGTSNVKSSRTLNNLPVGSTLNILMVGQKAASTDNLGVAVGNSNFVLGGSFYQVVWQGDNNLVIYKVVSGVTTPLINGFYSTSDTNIHSLSFTIVTGAATNILTASIDGQDALSISDPAIAFTSAGFISLCTGKMWDFEVSSNNLDQVPDGPTYSRPLKTRINAGRPWIDFTETIHVGKILDNIGDGSGFGRSPLGFYGGGGPSGKLTGFSINDNPDFLSGLARYAVYDNNATGHVTLSLVADTTAPNASGQKMRVSYSAGGESPGWGGFFLGFSQDSGNVAPFTYHRGNTLIHKIVANIPVGYTLNFSSNATGAEGTFTWISSTAGTGAWATYVGKQRIGITGTFSSTGFYYLNGQAAPPASFDVAHCEVVDIDQVHRYGVASIDANFRAGIDFTQSLHIGKNVDNLSDGSTFGRPLLSRLSSGKPFIDFTESIHIGKNLDNIGEGASFKRVGASWIDASSRVLIDFSLGAHSNRSQDFIPDGTTYGRVQNAALTGNQIDIAKSGVVGKAVEMVRNPDFESGSRDWNLGSTFSIVNDGNAYTGSWALKSVISTSSDAARNTIFIAVQPGDVILAMCMIKVTAGGGSGFVRVTFQNSGGTEIGTPAGNVIASSTYLRSRVAATAPANAVTARVECVSQFATSATTIYFDQFNATMTLKNADELTDGTGSPLAGGKRGFSAIDSGNIVITTAIDFSRGYSNKHLDNIPDGSTYSRALGTRLNAGRPLIDFTETIHIGKNLDNITDTITYQRKRPASLRAVDTPYNSDFEIWADNSTTGDGWTPAFEVNTAGSTYSRGAGFFGNFGQSIATVAGNGGSVASRPVPVRPNTKYEISCRYVSNVATTTGLYIRVCWYLNDGDFSRGSTSVSGHSLDDVLSAAPTTTSWQFAGGTFTSPSDAKYAVLAIYNYLPNVTSTFTFDSVNIRPADTAFVDGGVDANGNLLLKNVTQASGSTVGPSTTSGSYSGLPEMSVTRTTKGNPVLVTFTGLFETTGSAGSVFVQLFRDGSAISFEVFQQAPAASQAFVLELTWLDSPSAGSHTYEIQWHGSPIYTSIAIGTSRAMQLVELG